MPYIKEDIRKELDVCIEKMITCLGTPKSLNGNMTNEDFVLILGDINYVFSRIISSLMGRVSYSKIAMITGVLENIKQEYYRRVASAYEDKKIVENGDIPEYLKLG
jgi:CO dehydrogenase/acetyl-CoA synthase epsilon subunit